MIFFLFFFLSSQIIPTSSQLDIIGIDFLALLPDSETDLFLNPANTFFWDKNFLFSFASYHPYIFLNENSPITFQTLLNTKIGQKNYFLDIAYHYLFSNEKKGKKFTFLNYHNLPFSIGYNFGKRKIGLGVNYQRFYIKRRNILNQDFIEKREYLPFKIGFLKGEEEKFEIITEFIPFDSNNFKGHQLNFTIKKTLGEIQRHSFLFLINYQKEASKKNWQFIGGYCLISHYNFYGFIFNNLFSLKPIIFIKDKNNFEIKIIFPYGIISSFGKMRFLFGLKKVLIFNKENIYSTDYEYNFGLNYRLSNNFEFYFFNFLVNTFRKWFFSFKLSF